MTTDPFEQLRIDDELVTPDPTFVTRLRRRVVAGLEAAAALDAASTLPKVRLSERSSAMTDTTTRAAGAATAAATPQRSLTPYVCVTPAIEALAWYVDVLDAVETVRYTGDDGRVGHAEVTISGATLMLSDEYPELDVVAPTTLGGTPTTLRLEVPDVDATYERAVAAGARPAGAPTDEAYGARSFSMLDPFGHRWVVQTPIATPTNEEIQAASPGFTVTAPDPARSAAPAPVVELGYLTLGLPDVAVASRFYEQLFGWATEQGSMGDGYAHVHNTRLPVGFVTAPAAEAPVLYFKVGDLAAAVARVRALGGEVIGEDVYASGPNASCRDDQGREFQLWQPAPGYE